VDGKTLIAVHQHNERDAAAGIVARLQRGERVAYVSDAGTPAVSDPGAALVAAVQAAGLRAVPVPGASSVVTALSVAGDAAGAAFTFHGFAPPRGTERAALLKACAEAAPTQVLFEAPHRIDALAAVWGVACPQRRLTVARELTKQFETVHTLWAGEFAAWLAGDAHRGRGEFVLVLHARGASDAAEPSGATDATLRTLLAALSLKQAVALAAELTGASRNALYERALVLRGDGVDR
jgi:16S rRNA (cytidine1402-2'-O)-methyltransferase